MIRLARRRRTLLLKDARYQEVPELAKARGLLKGEKFDKRVAFLEGPAGERLRTNNHVERTNRKLRFDEKVRYKFRTQGSLDRFLRLRLDRLGRQPLSAPPPSADAQPKTKTGPNRDPNSGSD